jgi:hypothetical protein
LLDVEEEPEKDLQARTFEKTPPWRSKAEEGHNLTEESRAKAFVTSRGPLSTNSLKKAAISMALSSVVNQRRR